LTLDKSIARRIVTRLRWLAENLDNLRLETLIGDLLGFTNFEWETIVFYTRYLELNKPW